ncbi:hypothetical protein AB3A93_004540 [Vibrio parahaemolyticus]|uniref:hypothetical protein n=1 Tax=Vibrio parahaemolyticus TaxID=670 RepID=UPI00111F963C|nr:hypothetical protein [Vibrio parahaemolyticus]ELB2920242.1 hypothetical protein [Vibrio parahaemolyticus]MDF4677423.1 hypothetical protein [Vibrio parahaemolyticus]MDF4701573.1 hypothetical protein [Vibrio parahaemolyticus]TON06987.1 hypothetical protein CGH63_24265 [Vibrio parahaemolyticus]TOO29314.1 hypothetical protein CGH39_24550 [Vibrio parahaemolyticus]
MLFNNDIDEMISYLERFCKEPHIKALDNVSDEQINLLLDFLTLAHKLKCDIYATSNLNSSHFVGVGVFALSQDRSPQGNLFLKVEFDRIYLSFELDSCNEENLLTPVRVIDALVYLAEKDGHTLLPENYK